MAVKIQKSGRKKKAAEKKNKIRYRLLAKSAVKKVFKFEIKKKLKIHANSLIGS